MSALVPSGLIACPIDTLEDVECLRQIRNACRMYMTNDTQAITPESQAVWYRQYCADGPAVIQVWLILRAIGVVPIGFLSLRYAHTRRWPRGDTSWERGKMPVVPGQEVSGVQDYAVITLGLVSSERDRGYGTAIYRYAREVAGCEVRATIWHTNERSIRAAMKAGYQIKDDVGDTVSLVAPATGEQHDRPV